MEFSRSRSAPCCTEQPISPPSNYKGSYRVPNDFACCRLFKKLKIKARTKWCKAHYRWQWTPGGITLDGALFPLCSQTLLWDMKTVLMRAHTLDLEYAQSRFCLLSRKGKAATNEMWLIFFVLFFFFDRFVCAGFELEYCHAKEVTGLRSKWFTPSSDRVGLWSWLLKFGNFTHLHRPIYWTAMTENMKEHKAASWPVKEGNMGRQINVQGYCLGFFGGQEK